MTWRRNVNAALARATGFQVRRVQARRRPPARRRERPRPSDRLLEAPTFVLSSIRSGSTLLRVLLDSHSQIHAPPEIHLRDFRVRLRARSVAVPLGEVGLDAERLEFLLWDRVLHRELDASGKRWLVSKAPSNVFIADRIVRCWPDARLIFLLRHPAAIARSRQAIRPDDSPERNATITLRYLAALDRARRSHPGLTVRYEELTDDPEAVTRRVCELLGVPWEPQMLDYGRFDHGRLVPGIGDWRESIRSGRVQPGRPLPAPEEIPPQLLELAVAWGYVPDARVAS